ncbi:MAG: BPL-N domain-containing protein [Actinomycetes bacterium]
MRTATSTITAVVVAAALMSCGSAQSQASAPSQAREASSTAAAPATQSSSPPNPTSIEPRSGRPLALVYRGPAGCEGCSEPVARMLRNSRYGFDVRYIGPDETLKLEASSFAGATLYAQPGGEDDTPAAYQSLGASGQQAIRNFVAAGGRYLGICQGAYLAGTRYSGLGLLAPGNVGWYIGSRGASTRSEDPAVIPIKWGKRTFYLYFQDGPYMIPSGVAGERVLARYTNGRAAVLVRPYGSGRVAAVGPHPEATRSWYSEDGLHRRYPDAINVNLGDRILAQLMR